MCLYNKYILFIIGKFSSYNFVTQLFPILLCIIRYPCGGFFTLSRTKLTNTISYSLYNLYSWAKTCPTSFTLFLVSKCQVQPGILLSPHISATLRNFCAKPF